jgi:hypothetical protein
MTLHVYTLVSLASVSVNEQLQGGPGSIRQLETAQRATLRFHDMPQSSFCCPLDLITQLALLFAQQQGLAPQRAHLIRCAAIFQQANYSHFQCDAIG